MSGGGEFRFTDLHNHLVPGVDDGARDLREALEGVARFREVGIARIATTPHLDAGLTREPGRFRARLEELQEAWELLREGLERRFPDTELHRGYEIMLDVPKPDLAEWPVGLGETSFVLVEWPWLQVPPETTRVLERIRASGLRPIVAHPERYRGLDPELDLPRRWRDAGACLQVNYGSLAGRYGQRPKKRALFLLERGWVDLLSSDFHGRSHLPVFIREAELAFREVGGEEQFRLLAETNTGRVLRGEEPIPVEPLDVDRGVWSRLRSLLSGAD